MAKNDQDRWEVASDVMDTERDHDDRIRMARQFGSEEKQEASQPPAPTPDGPSPHSHQVKKQNNPPK